MENDLYRDHDEVEDFPEGGTGKARKHVNEELIPEAEVLKTLPILQMLPVKQQESLTITTSGDFSEFGLTGRKWLSCRKRTCTSNELWKTPRREQTKTGLLPP